MVISDNTLHYSMGDSLKKFIKKTADQRSSKSSQGKKTILLTLGSGGHTKQAILLSKRFKDSVDYEYLINNDDTISSKKIIYKGRIFRIIRPRALGDNKFSTIIKTIVSFLDAFSIIMRSKSDTVISTGPGLAFPILFWAKIFRKKTVFIESWSRVTQPSLAGKLCYKIADQFFIQWPDLKKEYPKSIYAGRLG